MRDFFGYLLIFVCIILFGLFGLVAMEVIEYHEEQAQQFNEAAVQGLVIGLSSP